MRPKAPKHKRLKRKATSDPNPVEQAHHDRLRELGCVVCQRPPHIHHIMSAPDKRCRRDHELVAPLCPEHHQGTWGIHGHRVGSEAKFKELYGIDLLAYARNAWQETLEGQLL